jgi:hypothetical protein
MVSKYKTVKHHGKEDQNLKSPHFSFTYVLLNPVSTAVRNCDVRKI